MCFQNSQPCLSFQQANERTTKYEKQLDAQDQVVALGVFSILNDKELHDE